MTTKDSLAEAWRKRESMLPFLVLLIGSSLFLLKMIQPYVIAIVMGGIIALLIRPLDRYFRRKGLRPAWSAGVVTVIMLVGIALPLSAIASAAVRQAAKLAALIAALEVRPGEILQRVTALPFVDRFIDDPAQLASQIRTGIAEMTQWFTAQIVQVASSVPESVLQFFLLVLTCYYALLDGDRFFAWLEARDPLDPDVRMTLKNTLRDTAISVVWASMAAAAVQAGVMLVAYLTLGVPLAYLAAAATFIFAWIPIVGSTPVWVVGALVLYFVDQSPGKAIAMIAFGIVTGIADNFVRPVVLKGRSEMHPLVSLVSIFGGIRMWGMVGVILGPILAAFVITMLQIWPMVGRRAGLTFNGMIEGPNGGPP